MQERLMVTQNLTQGT